MRIESTIIPQTRLYKSARNPKSDMSRNNFNSLMKMRKELMFSAQELTVLEALEVRGGQAEAQTIQNQCPNNATGCACTVVLQPSKGQ